MPRRYIEFNVLFTPTVLMWWTLQLSKDVILSTAPGTPWQDHWLQVIYIYIPIYTQSVYPFSPEITFDQKPVKLTVNHNELMIWFEISKISKEEHVQVCRDNFFELKFPRKSRK